MGLKQTLLDEILPVVQRPSRYVGSELNSVHKDAAKVELRIALAFPDLYDLGIGNLGLHILYAILNDLPWCWAERAYAPAPDMESALRVRGLPLFAHESKDPLSAMDLIGFSAQSELTYTSILNMIDLAGIPLRAANRVDPHPLIFAGGPAAINPEPLAPFMDFIAIGDGEEIIVEIAERIRAMKGAPRRSKLEAVAGIPGIYVPGLYPTDTLSDGRIVPREGAATIVRRIVTDLDAARFPTAYPVPFTQQVHDRVGLEIMRGCTRGCRFCQAGIVNRPVRERSIARLGALMDAALLSSGYEEVSLLSLSSCDYSRIGALLEQSARRAHADNVAVSLPSLRLDSFSVELADRVSGVRRSGLTFAPEAASQRLRAVINKWVSDEQLIEMCAEAFQLGWRHVKCYFMIGLPTERDADVEAIADLCLRVLARGRSITPKAMVFTGVSTFVPKPFTPFQWAEQIGYDEVLRRQGLLKKAFHRKHGIKFGRHEPEATFVEGLIARGDRRTADLIEAAFRRGARLDTSSEYLRFDAWRGAVAEVGYDVEAAFRQRGLDERLPWDHIDVRVPKKWLKEEWLRALALESTADCREGRCNHCGLRMSVPDLCQTMLENAAPGPKTEIVQECPAQPPMHEPQPAQRLRFRIGRRGEVRFLSNLEWMAAWARALRRARLPLAYSQGFHAHPKASFSTAPPVGEESEGDYMDIVLTQRRDPQQALEALKKALPEGFSAGEVEEIPMNAPSLMSAVTGFAYTLYVTGNPDRLAERVEAAKAAPVLLVERKGKTKKSGNEPPRRTWDIRPSIIELSVGESVGVERTVDLVAMGLNRTMAKPREIIQILGLDPATTRVVKRKTFL